MKRLIFSACLCLFLFGSVKADPIVLDSGTVALGVRASSTVTINVQGPRFVYNGVGTPANTAIRGLGDFFTNGSVNFFDVVASSALGILPPGFRQPPSQFTVDGVNYYFGGGGEWHFYGTALVAISEPGLHEVQAPFSFDGILSARELSDPDGLGPPIVFSFVGQGIATFFIQANLLDGNLVMFNLSGPPGVVYTFQTPEPASIVLLSLGSIYGYAVARRRLRKPVIK